MTTPEEICLDDIEIPSAQFTNTPASLHGPVIITSDHHHKRQSIISRINGQRNKIFSRRLFYRKVLQGDNESGDSITEWERCDDFGSTPFIQQNSVGPYSIQSNYTSRWTNNSSTYRRINSSISSYYYETYEIDVVVASNYSFSTKSQIDTYGYIYNNSFHPTNPSLNLLIEDDNGDGNKQFRFKAFLIPWTKYILVVTTFSPNTLGAFQIVVTGPTAVAIRSICIPNIQSTIYSSQWTIHSPKYCRDRCLMSDDDYEFDKDYYYEAILVNVSAASNVTIMSKSNVNTYGYIYENSFDPSDSSLNLLVEDDNSGDNEQFQLSAFLQPSTIYILVATTSYPYVMGTFSIIATGSHLASLTRTNARWPSIRKTTIPWSTQSTYSSAWSTESPSYCRTNCIASDSYYYEAIRVRVSNYGIFSLTSKSNIDTYGYLYINTFDPASPSSNLLLENDDGGGSGQFGLTYSLLIDSIYVLVATTYYPNVTGLFSVSAPGPGFVTFSAYVGTKTL
ncbi:unnamed protein product [Rotaria socialis]|uniref:Uncharacterized protein n=1 Tax=Rotaria socialis TaxID=392032 RepID=A0A820VT89_9BILA|nr:unnamed protein product [Rotaria socialis]CAF4299615.1 unnamed protein product [Rotaria socialis]CAF4506843.1 unnamed protein product [Rotaria socialis]